MNGLLFYEAKIEIGFLTPDKNFLIFSLYFHYILLIFAIVVLLLS
jgi:hypothetical protein